MTDTAVVTCVHHWVIDPPHGEFSPGCCVYCGEVRMFRNRYQARGFSNHIRCRECGEPYPFNADFFSTAAKKGLTTICLECRGV